MKNIRGRTFSNFIKTRYQSLNFLRDLLRARSMFERVKDIGFASIESINRTYSCL